MNLWSTAGQVALHEGVHCAALLTLGLPPKRVRIDEPDAETAGVTELDWGDGGVDLDKGHRVLGSVLVGGLHDGGADWERWPFVPDRVAPTARGDARKALRLAETFDFDGVDCSASSGLPVVSPTPPSSADSLSPSPTR